MKKSLLTFVLLSCVIIAGAANRETKHVKARPHMTAPVSLTESRKAGNQRLGNAETIGSQSLKTSKPRKEGEKVSVDLNFSSADYSYKWFDGEDASFWYFGCFDDSGNWLLRLAYNTESQTGRVTYSDMNHDYSYLTYSNENDDPAYKEMTYDEGTELNISEDDQFVTVTGVIYCGDSIFNVNAKCEKPQPKTYDIEGTVLTMAEYDSSYQQWDVRFRDADKSWKVSLSLKSEDGNFVRDWTIDDASEDGCYATDLNEDEDYAFTEMNVTTTLPEGETDPTRGCEITGTAKDADGNTFNFHMKKDAPIKPVKVKDVEVDVVEAQWPSETTGGSYYVLTEKADPRYKWVLSLFNKVGEANELENIDTAATYRVDTMAEPEKKNTINNGTITQTFDAEKLEVAVNAALVMNDSVQYNFSFTTPVSKEGEETLSFTDLQVDESYSEYGSTTLNASNDSIQFSCELTDYATIPGEYTDENCRISLNVYDNYGMPTYVSCNALIYAKGEIADDGTSVFTAKFLGENKIVYTVEANYVKPEVEDTLDITLEDCDFGNNVEWGDGFYFCSTQDDKFIWIRMESQDKVEGHYTIADVNNNSRIEIVNKYGMPKQFYLSDADFTVTNNGATYTLEGKCQAGPYLVNLRMTTTQQGLDYDNYEEDATDKDFLPGNLVELSADEDQRYVYLKMVNTRRNDEICLLFFPEEFDGVKIPAAEYEISSYGWGNYVQAGMPEYDGTVYPSYYAKLDSEGYIQAPMWFLNSGTVTVSKVLGYTKFVVDATNSYGRAVKATGYFNATPTDISSVKEDTQDVSTGKFVKNGQITIRKAGIDYNVLGQRK